MDLRTLRLWTVVGFLFVSSFSARFLFIEIPALEVVLSLIKRRFGHKKVLNAAHRVAWQKAIEVIGAMENCDGEW